LFWQVFYKLHLSFTKLLEYLLMRIYYFGKLIEDTNETKTVEQTKLKLDEPKLETTALQSISDILHELDLYQDVYPSESSKQLNRSGGLHHA